MSSWPGKTIIGLTGNIATGKSVVRKMLEHLGAYGIDADALAHRAIAQGAPGYQPVLDTFGRWVLSQDGQIDRSRLGRIVFSDPEALRSLESIVHPLVGQAVDILVRRSQQKVVVVEAIKLLESDLGAKCDSVWVSVAPIEVQVARLVQKRGMTQELARQRIQAQPPPKQKIAAADVVIRNSGSFEDTWQQVVAAWQETFPAEAAAEVEPEETTEVFKKGELWIQRARPRQADEIAALMAQLSQGQRKLNREGVMAAFGEKAFLIIKLEGKPVGVAGWKVENLVAHTDEIYLDPGVTADTAMKALMEEVERASRELQCEISLIYLPNKMVRQTDLAKELGYQVRSIQSLGVRAWQEAAVESMPGGSVLLFKQLRQDRVLRPV